MRGFWCAGSAPLGPGRGAVGTGPRRHLRRDLRPNDRHDRPLEPGSPEALRWAVPGSNGRPPACKARAAAAVYCGLSLRPLGERWSAPGCCALLRFAASKALPREPPPREILRGRCQPLRPNASRAPRGFRERKSSVEHGRRESRIRRAARSARVSNGGDLAGARVLRSPDDVIESSS